jgi:hypothetical protein
MLPLRPQWKASALLRLKICHAPSPFLSRTIPSRFASTTTRRPSARLYIYGTAFIVVGAVIGTGLTAVIRPPPFPPAGSDADAKLLGQLAKEIDNLPIVKSLRRGTNITVGTVHESLHKDTGVSIRGNNPITSSGAEDEWIELSVSYESSNTMLNGMLGFGKMGIQRAFWQPATREIVMILWYGGALTGWPGIAHGGCTATFFIEGLGKAVNCVKQLDDSGNGMYWSISLTLPSIFPLEHSLTELKQVM